jgi:hypothetical protein
LISLTEEDIVALLDIPDDVRILGIRDNWRTMGLEIMVEGERFEETSEHAEPPYLEKDVDYELVKVLTDEEEVYLRRWKVVFP